MRLAAELRSEQDLVAIAQRQKDFKDAVAKADWLKMSHADMQFHMAIAHAGKNPSIASFHERLLKQGRRMLRLHFAFLERTSDGYLLTDEHNDMLEAIRQKDIERADELAHAHTRQFRDNFFDFMKENHATGVNLTGLRRSA